MEKSRSSAIRLTDEQKDAYGQLKDFLKGRSGLDYIVLRGYAGTGKTTLITELCMEKSKEGNDVFMTAPTNKAVKVLKQTMGTNSGRIGFMTIHKLLGLKRQFDEDGNEFFGESWEGPCIHGADILIIDEVSMLSNDLFEELVPYMGLVPMIMVGDPAQIPPVNHKDSIPISSGTGPYLKNIQRQKADSPIIDLSDNIRNGEGKSILEYGDKDNIGILRKRKDRDKTTSLLRECFTSSYFHSDPDHAKVIAWTNKMVDRMNSIIRSMIYGDKSSLIESGEKLIANSPITIENKIELNTNDEFIVNEVSIGHKTVRKKKLKCYKANVSHFDVDMGERRLTIPIIHESSREELNDLLQTMKSMAIKEKDVDERKKKWKMYYEARERFADVAYNYAITCHKSQGSSYRNTFIMMNDILKNWNSNEAKRILYTAVTRASERVNIIC